jgi:hypothetical protein
VSDDDALLGAGGLTFEPPAARDDEAPALGFAPDLDDGVAPALDWSAPPRDAAGEARPRRAEGRYPLAEAALLRLLGDGVPAPPRPGDDGEAFSLGPSIMRPPPGIALPPPAAADALEEDTPRSRTDLLMEDMVEMMLVGDDEGSQQIHLVFKEEVFGGLHLKLERRDEGLFATFLVDSDNHRRGVQGQVELLLARLRSRGTRIAGHAVEVRSD